MTAGAMCGVFLLCGLVDMLWLGWTRSVHSGSARGAAAYAALIQLVGVVSILLVVDDRRLLIANVLGHAAGSYVGVRFLGARQCS